MNLLMSDKLDKILPLIAKVKKSIVGVSKKSDNPFFKSNYADLNEHLDVVEPVLEDNGLILLQPVVSSDMSMFVNTMIIDPASGQYIGCSIRCSDLKDAQKTGAAITYYRRYGINSLLALKTLDDDGESAVGRGKVNKGSPKKHLIKSKSKSTPSTDEF